MIHHAVPHPSSQDSRENLGDPQNLCQQLRGIIITDPDTPNDSLLLQLLHLFPDLFDPPAVVRGSREMDEVEVEVFQLQLSEGGVDLISDRGVVEGVVLGGDVQLQSASQTQRRTLGDIRMTPG